MLFKTAGTLLLSNRFVLVTTSCTLAEIQNDVSRICVIQRIALPGSAKGCCFNKTSAEVPLFAATSNITSAWF